MALSPVRLRASMSVGSADTIAFTRSNSPALIASMKAALLEVVSGMPRFYRAPAPPASSLLRRGGVARAGAPTPAAVPGTAAARRLDHRRGARHAAGEREPLLAARHRRARRDRRSHRHRRPQRRRRRRASARTAAPGRRRSYRVGDADITNPSGTGDAAADARASTSWERVDVATGLMPIDVSAPGMAVTLMPRRPRGVVDAGVRAVRIAAGVQRRQRHGVAAGDHRPELVGARQPASSSGAGVAGPRSARSLSATWTRSSHFERDSPTALDAPASPRRSSISTSTTTRRRRDPR